MPDPVKIEEKSEALKQAEDLFPEEVVITIKVKRIDVVERRDINGHAIAGRYAMNAPCMTGPIVLAFAVPPLPPDVTPEAAKEQLSASLTNEIGSMLLQSAEQSTVISEDAALSRRVTAHMQDYARKKADRGRVIGPTGLVDANGRLL